MKRIRTVASGGLLVGLALLVAAPAHAANAEEIKESLLEAVKDHKELRKAFRKAEGTVEVDGDTVVFTGSLKAFGAKDVRFEAQVRNRDHVVTDLSLDFSGTKEQQRRLAGNLGRKFSHKAPHPGKLVPKALSKRKALYAKRMEFSFERRHIKSASLTTAHDGSWKPISGASMSVGDVEATFEARGRKALSSHLTGQVEVGGRTATLTGSVQSEKKNRDIALTTTLDRVSVDDVLGWIPNPTAGAVPVPNALKNLSLEDVAFTWTPTRRPCKRARLQTSARSSSAWFGARPSAMPRCSGCAPLRETVRRLRSLSLSSPPSVASGLRTRRSPWRPGPSTWASATTR